MSKESKKKIRCAIYTRKSTEEGLEQEFNSLDAQREAGEAFISSQKHEGWVCLKEGYDDGGFTGGNIARPALQRLLADVEQGNVDCIVVYKVDRLSRSLLDFAQIMGAFDKAGVSFVSVTQQFNTTSSMGRLTLNILLSFAQFEREIISERTRDKIAATRRKGKWSGGRPVLGYDAVEGKLVVNEDEARQVQAIFELYLEQQSMIETVDNLNTRGWTNKKWVTRKGHEAGGKPFDKAILRYLLTNPIYIGKVTYKDEVHPGEHPAIVSEAVFQRAQKLLHRNKLNGGKVVRNRFGALLKGLLRCTSCDCAMGHTHSTRGNKRYRYYVCTHAQKSGWKHCPAPSLPAGEIEKFVAEQIKTIGTDEALLGDVIDSANKQNKREAKELSAEKQRLEKEFKQLDRDLHDLLKAGGANTPDLLADIEVRVVAAKSRAAEVTSKLQLAQKAHIEDRMVSQLCSEFEPAWENLTPKERARIIHLLVERVDHDGEAGSVTITFQPNGIKTFSQELEEAQS